MSLPEFTTGTSPSREEAINQIIASIAMEELGISHIINAEGEKLQYVLGTIPGITSPAATIDDVLKVNESVRAVLQHATESQSLLRNKLQNALASAVLTGPMGSTGPTGATGPATIDVSDVVTELEPGQPPTVVNAGSTGAAVLEFGIPRGATGVTGATGAIGPTGAASLAAYGTFVSTGTKNIVTGASVTLNNSLGTAPVGMALIPGETTVTIANPGVYRIDYRISTTTETGTDALVSLLHNGNLVPGSGILTLEAIGKISGVVIMTLDTGDTIAIGTSVAQVLLPDQTNAFLGIIQIA